MSNDISIASNFINDLHQVYTIIEQQQSNHPDPVRGLSQQADLVCDALLDADIQRTVLEEHHGHALAEELLVQFPDQSVMTAVVEWCADRIYLSPGDMSADSWMLSPQTLRMHPIGVPGIRIFDAFEDAGAA